MASERDMPQWKKDLILRRRNQNRQSSLSESSSCCGSSTNTRTMTTDARKDQQSPTSCTTLAANVADVAGTCSRSSGQQPIEQYRSSSPKPCVSKVTLPVPRAPAMVQERAWIDHGVDVLVKKLPTATGNNNMDTNGADKNSVDSDSSEELQYGPGIVSKLKNRYLSLTLRETNNRRSRPSILNIMHMRKAASLEYLLEDDHAIKSSINNSSNGNSGDGQHPYERNNSVTRRPVNGTCNGTEDAAAARNASNRYRKLARGHNLTMKRAHSIETISLQSAEDSLLQDTEVVSRHQQYESMYDNNTLLIRPEGGNYNKKETSVITDYQNAAKVKQIFDSGVTVNNIPTPRVNRPTKLKPIVNENEKPPADVVKETKKKFEGRPDSRTRPPHQTGDVAAKIASYSNIIVKTKVSKMPLASKYHKPNVVSNKSWTDKKESKPADLSIDHKWTNNTRTKTLNSPDVAMVSPIPDVSRLMDSSDMFERDHKVNSSLCETPDLLLHSSPAHTPHNSQYNRDRKDSNSSNSSQPLSPASQCSQNDHDDDDDDDDDSSSEDTVHSIRISTESQKNISTASNSEAFNFNTIRTAGGGTHLPIVDRKPPKPPLHHTEPLHVEVNHSHKTILKQRGEQLLKKPQTNGDTTSPVLSPILTSREIEKNIINVAKSRDVEPSPVPVLVVDSRVQAKSSSSSTSNVPKPKKPAPQPNESTTLFDFTNRNLVPDYVRNDGSTRSVDIPKPKDSGTTTLPGYQEDPDIDLSSPPSPCNVTFINDNVLISGRSSISKRPSKRVSLQKIRLQFNTSPEVYEYPSEKSILGEDREDITSPTVGHTVPLLSGSTLANYQPKSGFSIEDFQLGVTKAATVSTNSASSATTQEDEEKAKTERQTLSDIHEPIMFSAGTNSDILF